MRQNLLHVPRDANPSKKTWLWIGAGVLGVSVLGYAWYRKTACDVPRLRGGSYYGDVVTKHPKVLTAEQLSKMSSGDRVQVVVGAFDKTHNWLPGRGLQTVPATLVEREDGPWVQPCPSPTLFRISGAAIHLDGSIEQGFAQWSGSLFPAGFQGTVTKAQVISPPV